MAELSKEMYIYLLRGFFSGGRGEAPRERKKEVVGNCREVLYSYRGEGRKKKRNVLEGI